MPNKFLTIHGNLFREIIIKIIDSWTRKEILESRRKIVQLLDSAACQHEPKIQVVHSQSVESCASAANLLY